MLSNLTGCGRLRMKPKPHFLPPRQWVIVATTRRMLDETAMNAASFAMSVAELYLSRTAPDARTVPFKLGDDLIAAMRANAQTLRRYMEGTVKSLPCDLEDAWVLALPEPYRSDCEAELSRRRGRLSVSLPAPTADDDAHAIAELLRSSGVLCASFGACLADGKIDQNEQRVMLNQSDAVLAAVLQLRVFLLEQTEKRPSYGYQ